MEYETCEAFGIDPAAYFAKPREERALMVAYVVGKKKSAALLSHDVSKQREHSSKTKAKAAKAKRRS